MLNFNEKDNNDQVLLDAHVCGEQRSAAPVKVFLSSQNNNASHASFSLFSHTSKITHRNFLLKFI